MKPIHRAAIRALLITSCLTAPGLAFSQGAPAAPQESTLEELVVTGQITYRDRTDTVAPALVYDQQFFEKFEPVSVGDQLKRVPGVAFTSDIGEHNSPQLRGLGNGFTQILINGRPVPGAGNDRSVFVDRIPAEIIDHIEIIRSPSADIDSQGVGGTINIVLKDGASLPPGVIARVGVTHDIDNKKTEPTGAISVSGRNDAETLLYSFTVDGQRRFNRKHSLQEVIDNSSPEFAAAGDDGHKLISRNASQSTAVERTEEEDGRHSTDLSFNGDLTWRPNDETSLRFDGYFLRTKRNEHQDTYDYERDDPADPFEGPEYSTEDTKINQKSFGLAALFDRKLGDNTSFQSQVRYSGFRDDEFQLKLEDDDGAQVPDESEAVDAKDNEWTADASIKSQFPDLAEQLGMAGIQLKIGVAGKLKDRDYGITNIGHLSDSPPDEAVTNAFQYKEKRFDSFAVAEFKLTPSLKLETGLRAEYTKTEQDLPGGADTSAHEFQLNPSAHLQWEITGSDQFRASVARTVRRPAIDQLVPSITRESPGDEDVTIGNPDLEFETSLGFDFGYERRFAGQGVFGVNLFYRNIDNLIGLVATGEPASAASADIDPDDFPGGLYTYQNLGKAKTHGIEFDLSTPLTMIGLEETGVFANYTRLWSHRTEPQTGIRTTIDAQPKYVYNVGLTQNIPTWDASFGVSYQKQGRSRNYFLGEVEDSRYSGNLEVFVERRFGKQFVLRLSGNNLLDSRSLQSEAHYDGDSAEEIIASQQAGEIKEFEVEREESSPTITLTLRAVF